MSKVDPVHFFNARGKAILTQDHQEDRIRSLLLENQKLKQLLKATTGALKSQQSREISAFSEILH